MILSTVMPLMDTTIVVYAMDLATMILCANNCPKNCDIHAFFTEANDKQKLNL